MAPRFFLKLARWLSAYLAAICDAAGLDIGGENRIRPGHIGLAVPSSGSSELAETSGQDIPSGEEEFTAYMAHRLKQMIGNGAAVEVIGPLTLSLGRGESYLDRIHSFCQKNPADCADEVEAFLRSTAESYSHEDDEPTAEAIRLVVRSELYFREMQQSLPPEAALQARAFVGGLVIVPVFDWPRTTRLIAEHDGARLGLTMDEIYELAIANLRTTLQPLEAIATSVGYGQLGELWGDSYHPSRLVLHDTWASLAEAQDDVLIAAAPASNLVYYIGDDSEPSIRALRSVVEGAFDKAPHPLSNVLLRWTPTGWSVVPRDGLN